MKKIYLFAEYILQLLSKSWRIKLLNELPESPAVIAFWHCDMLSVWKLFSKKSAYAIVSMNKDGEILSHLLSKWKYQLVRGSSSKGGKNVIKTITDLNENNYFLITPDGPRGPRHIFKTGAFVIAQKKQIPLYFVKCKIGSKKVFHKSWDKFILPLPLSKIEIEFSVRLDMPLEIDKSGEYIFQLMEKYNKQFGEN